MIRLSVEPEELATHGRAVQGLSADVHGAGTSAESAIGTAAASVGDAGLAGALGEATAVVSGAATLAATLLDALGRNTSEAGGAYRRTDGGIAGAIRP